MSTPQRQHGRQGPPHDPNRDGCGPAVLLVLATLLAIVVTLARAVTG